MSKKRKSIPNTKSTRIDRQSLAIIAFFVIFILSIVAYQFYYATPKSLWVNKNKAISNEQVCMVNDVFMGKKQIPVLVEGNTYYGCCHECVSKLQSDRDIRYAVDPLTGDSVDKAKAFIVLRNKVSDSIWYFESEENYRLFMASK